MNSYEKVKYNELQVGDILAGVDEVIWHNKYEIIQILDQSSDRLRTYIKCGTEIVPYDACSHYTFRINRRYMPYDPTQQGDTDEDI